MLGLFVIYWAFFTWFFYDNFVVNYIYSLMTDGYFSVCYYYDPTDYCNLDHLISNFPSGLAFIVALLLMTGHREDA
jgi:hypothetical protein